MSQFKFFGDYEVLSWERNKNSSLLIEKILNILQQEEMEEI